MDDQPDGARVDEARRAFLLGRETDNDLVATAAHIRLCVERTLGLELFPEQVAGGLALACGCFCEMATGEGKTVTGTLPAVIGAWRGQGCHVLTANDYLVERDRGLNAPLFDAMGLTSASVRAGMSPDERRAAYRADVVYLSAKQACADHLSDRLMSGATRSAVGRLAHVRVGTTSEPPLQRTLACAIVDEADSLLIDDATVPLVLSGDRSGIEEHADPRHAASVAGSLRPLEHYRVRRAHSDVHLTRGGRAALDEHAETLGGVTRRVELVESALRALLFYERDRDYIVKDGRIVIVDPSTGRTMPDRTWRHALQQAVEAKEGLALTTPAQTHASLSFQRFFARYDRVCGMSGTLREVARELRVIYGQPVVVVPTHRPMIRTRERNVLFANASARWRDVVRRVLAARAVARPVLIGTNSVRSSEHLSRMFQDAGIAHDVLNANRDREEASIIVRAGRAGAVTIATNMAGRGTDIRLDQPARDAGGMHVIVAEFNGSERLDRQLLGRAGRQGDPGSGVVLASLEDDLLRRHAPVWSRHGAPGEGEVARPLARAIVGIARRRIASGEFSRRLLLSEEEERHDDALAFAGEPL